MPGRTPRIAETAPGLDPRAPHLAPQPHHGGFDGIVAAVQPVTIERLAQIGLRHGLARPVHQRVQQPELERGEVQRLAGKARPPGRQIHHQIAILQGIARPPCTPPQDRVQTGHQLVHHEWLDQIVIGSGIEGLHPLGPAVAGRDHHHRHRDPVGPPAPQHRQAVEPGQAEVEDGGGKRLHIAQRPAGLAIAGDFRPEPGALQAALQAPRDRLLILDNQHTHRTGVSPKGFKPDRPGMCLNSRCGLCGPDADRTLTAGVRQLRRVRTRGVLLFFRETTMRIGDALTTAPCILCHDTGRHVVATTGRGMTPLVTVICDGCGLVSHDPIPTSEELERFYGERYRMAYKGRWAPKPKHSLRAQRSAVLRAARLAPLIAPGARVLDIGASSGEFVYMMGQLGFGAAGIEPNAGYRAFGIEAYGVDVTDRRLEPQAFGAGVFDLITLNHVFEHLADPVAVLGAISHWLAPEGLLFIEVPNIVGVAKQRANLFHYAHIWNFAPHTLKGLLARAGFAPVPGENLDGTSLVFARTRVAGGMQAAAGPDCWRNPDLVAALRRQLDEDQSGTAYLASGAPFRRRWARLLRNIDEITTARRYPGPRAMADAVLAATTIATGRGRPVLPASAAPDAATRRTAA